MAVDRTAKRKQVTAANMPDSDYESNSDIEILPCPSPQFTHLPIKKKPRTSHNCPKEHVNATAARSVSKSNGNIANISPRKANKPNSIRFDIEGRKITTTAVFDMFWRYAAERQRVEERRRSGEDAPWTDDVILQKYRFCSVFRVSDAACQFLIREVIEKGSQDPQDVVFRVVLFNTFTRITTYQKLESSLGPLTWKRFNRAAYEAVLRGMEEDGQSLYTGAFQKPAPKLTRDSNWENHLELLEVMMRKEPNLTRILQCVDYLADAYDWINCLPGMGDFNSHQLLLDLTYAGLNGKGIARFHPSDFVVAGIGAVNGIEKCFNGDTKGIEVEIMRWMCENQTDMFDRLGLTFRGMEVKGSKKAVGMQLCDIEHTLCEVYKYEKLVRSGAGRASHSATGRTRTFEPSNTLPREVYLPKAWNNRSRTVPRVKPEKHTRVAKEYVVTRLLDKRRVESQAEDGTMTVRYEYFVDWYGYGAGDRTWEPEEMLKEDAPQAITEFERERKRKK